MRETRRWQNTHTLGKTHTGGVGCVVLAVVVGQVPVEEVVIVPTHHARVRPDAVETASNVVVCNGVETAADVQSQVF